MPSTYTTNNGIELIATGEQSGTWGTTTNTNLQFIDTALDGQATVTLGTAGSSGSPNSLPITDGEVSNGRNRLIVFTDGGDLGATAYVQLTPNDAEKVVFVRNDLSGGRSIILFQGTYSASNDFELPAGKDAIVKFDGAGSGAVVSAVFDDLYLAAASIQSLALASGATVTAVLDEDNMASNSATALATQQSIKAYVDAASTTYTAGTGLDLTGTEFSIDSTVATLTGTQTLTNKTIDAASNTLTGVVTLTGTQTLTNKTLTKPALDGTVTEEVYTISGTSVALEPDNGSFQLHTLTGNTTYTDGFSAGEAITLMVDDGSAYTITWPTITWTNNGGSAPTLATSGYTVISLWKISTTLYGALVADGS